MQWSRSIGRSFVVGMAFLGAIALPSYISTSASEEVVSTEEIRTPPTDPAYRDYGHLYPYPFYTIEEYRIRPGDYWGLITKRFGVDYTMSMSLIQKSKGIFDVRKLVTGKPLHVVYSDPCRPPVALIYRSSPTEYIHFNLRDTTVEQVALPVEIVVEAIAGTIDESLWLTLQKQNVSWELIAKMESALAWAVDFYHINRGDRFKAVYEQKYLHGEKVGLGKLLGAYFQTRGREYYVVYFDNGRTKGYFAPDGTPAKGRFLRSPVKFARITSRYNRRRFHPILKRVRPHLGTDYAAPYGTPILAVGDGVVERVGYTRGNGRYVKIRHDRVYQSQYLHMSRFAKGIRRGVRVRQGQVIGYVGSSGLATGPHVCFRFWKNGRQVDHLKLIFPPPSPLKGAELEDFRCATAPIVEVLESLPIPYPNHTPSPADRLTL